MTGDPNGPWPLPHKLKHVMTAREQAAKSTRRATLATSRFRSTANAVCKRPSGTWKQPVYTAANTAERPVPVNRLAQGESQASFAQPHPIHRMACLDRWLMYRPVLDGFSVPGSAVRYTKLPEDFRHHVLPEACVNLWFNQVNTEIAGVTALQTVATTLNLETSFHCVGVQLYPGVWRGDRNEIAHRYVGTPYQGTLPLVQTNQRLVGLTLQDMTHMLAEQVRWCVVHDFILANEITARILAKLDSIRSVADMAALIGLSPRQLQRTLKRMTSFAPHDLLKLLRVQQSFRMHYLDLYADQAHFNHAFRQATGYTPVQYRKRFGV